MSRVKCLAAGAKGGGEPADGGAEASRMSHVMSYGMSHVMSRVICLAAGAGGGGGPAGGGAASAPGHAAAGRAAGDRDAEHFEGDQPGARPRAAHAGGEERARRRERPQVSSGPREGNSGPREGKSGAREGNSGPPKTTAGEGRDTVSRRISRHVARLSACLTSWLKSCRRSRGARSGHLPAEPAARVGRKGGSR
eukprot:2741225-Pyramimonas_sp.AAC.1